MCCTRLPLKDHTEYWSQTKLKSHRVIFEYHFKFCITFACAQMWNGKWCQEERVKYNLRNWKWEKLQSKSSEGFWRPPRVRHFKVLWCHEKTRYAFECFSLTKIPEISSNCWVIYWVIHISSSTICTTILTANRFLISQLFNSMSFIFCDRLLVIEVSCFFGLVWFVFFLLLLLKCGVKDIWHDKAITSWCNDHYFWFNEQNKLKLT